MPGCNTASMYTNPETLGVWKHGSYGIWRCIVFELSMDAWNDFFIDGNTVSQRPFHAFCLFTSTIYFRHIDNLSIIYWTTIKYIYLHTIFGYFFILLCGQSPRIILWFVSPWYQVLQLPHQLQNGMIWEYCMVNLWLYRSMVIDRSKVYIGQGWYYDGGYCIIHPRALDVTEDSGRLETYQDILWGCDFARWASTREKLIIAGSLWLTIQELLLQSAMDNQQLLLHLLEVNL